MRTTITLLDKNSGKGKSGYTLKIYAYSTGSSGYSGAALYTLTDNGDGVYYTDVTTTMKGTVVITTPSTSTILVPTQYIGHLFQGDNQLTLEPGGSS